MQRQLSVLIVEDVPAECELLADSIASHEDLKVAGTTGDEQEALRMVVDCLPDVMILDLALTHGSGWGIGLLRKLQASAPSVRPYILVTTNNASAITNAMAREYGADYIMSKYQKDYSAQMVVDHLLAVKDTIINRPALTARPPESPRVRQKQLAARISDELDAVGISPKMLGRQYLEIGIRVMVLEPTQRLCATIAAEVGKTEPSVERAIKNAIDRAWRVSSDEELSHYTARIDPDRGVPTTTEFICFYANKLRREYG